MNRKVLTLGMLALIAITSFGCFLRPSNKESLHAFVMLDVGLLTQNDNLERNNGAFFNDFANQLALNPSDSIQHLNETAIRVGKLSKELSDFIFNMKVELVMRVDGIDEYEAKNRIKNPFMIKRKGDYDRPTHYFGTSSPPGNTGKANELKQKLREYKTKVLSYVNSKDQKMMEKKLNVFDLNDVEDKQAGTWEMFHFYHLPLSAALAELTRWQVVVREAELAVLSYLKTGSTTNNTMKFDAMEAIIVSESGIVTTGSTFEADVFLCSYSTTSKPKITYGASVDEQTGNVFDGIELNENNFSNGKGHLSVPVSGRGSRTLGGKITIVNPSTGEEMFYTFNTKYEVISKKDEERLRSN